MDYQKIYNELIEKARSEDRDRGKGGTYYEAHHIVPKCLGGEGKCSEWKTHPNIVLLTAEEHFYAHYYLIKIHPENSKLLFAFGAMCNMISNGRRVDRNYSEILNFAKMWKEAKIKRSEMGYSDDIRAKISTAQRGRSKTEEHRAKISATLKSKPARPPKSDETRAKLSLANRGKKLTPESITKRSAKRKGMKLGPQSIEHVSQRWVAVSQYSADGVWIKNWSSIKEAAEFLGIRSGGIQACASGKTKSSRGFIWKYLNKS